MHAAADGVWDGEEMGEVADRLLSPVAVIAPDSTLLYVNPAGARALGHEPGWLLGRQMLDLVHPDDRTRVSSELTQVASGRPSAGLTSYRIRADAARDWRVFESIADNLLDDSRVAGILISSRDITEQQAHERNLQEAAYRDPLTGLGNRAMIQDHLRAQIDDDTSFVIAFVGLDRFKLINDSLGHTAGDDVLRAASSRIVASLPSSAIVGRFAADVFAVILEGASMTEAHALIWQVVDRIGQPLFIGGRELRLSSSAGLAQRDWTATPESVPRDASLALDRAKGAGRGRVELFEAGLRDAAIARLELEADLRSAISGNELTLALQRIVRLDDFSAVRSEALARWSRPTGPVAPSTFIPVAEETGLIVPLGDWIIDRAAQMTRKAPGGQISINLSPRQLASPGLPERIARALLRYRLTPSSLAFEITETLLIEQFDYTVNVLQAIRDLGCLVGLDDFGTGYSSLSYLRRLPIDFLKIDGSLTADVDSDFQARAIIAAVIAMAGALGLDVIAEGVESASQASVLEEIGCQLGQGYFFGRPT